MADDRNAATRADRYAADRYALVFALLIVSYLTSALLTGSRARGLTLLLYLAALLIALRSARLPPRGRRPVRWAMLAGSLAAVAVSLAATGPIADGLVAIWLAAIVMGSVCVVVWRVLNHEVVTLQTVFGALSAYLLIGFMFASLFAAVSAFDPRPFFAGGQPTDSSNLQYFSFVTLTTTGYGDLTAANNWGRTLAAMDALLGQIFLVTLVARLVSVFGTARPRREGSGAIRVRSSGPADPSSDA
jgi:hypothetical protein